MLDVLNSVVAKRNAIFFDQIAVRICGACSMVINVSRWSMEEQLPAITLRHFRMEIIVIEPFRAKAFRYGISGDR
ncbi:hypothetical protein D5R40_32560 [Okeania hirsuta]|uniref:Uncharacterized protein n=1 Tax=Okeania hirsuta TaxID=1458930 RepID=A0A3N6P7J1_9CYAN|nr:hypothetical protein D5R40_32560 [Okeania hirsuta]